MKPLILLLVVFLVAALVSRLLNGEIAWKFAGKLALSIMLLFTALGHFKFSEGMILMLPPALPFKSAIIFLTGVFEILLAVTIWIPVLVCISGWALIIFLVLLLPSNIYASIQHVNLEKADFTGPGPLYLLFRIPLQLLFIAWTYFCCIAKP